jgi:acetolactate synthase-1/2/3 large subunit
MRVCDWIADYLYNQGVSKVHGLMGGGASGLNDGFIKHGKINYVCYHHEQGAGHAAIGESKFTGKLAVVNPTTGCAGTNCATSVLNAWQDSVPVLFLSGNVRLNTCSGWINQQKSINIRKYGVQEHHVVDTYRSMTKLSQFVTSAESVPYILQHAIHVATNGRPGPVWIDIPGDIQTAKMPEKYEQFAAGFKDHFWINYDKIKEQILAAERPVVLAGYGIRQAGVVNEFVQFIEKYKIPYVSTYGARDYTSNDYQLSMGAVGIKGSRTGNFVLQNADLLLVLGSSLNSSVIGYDPTQFSPASKKIVIDCDYNELCKDVIKIDEKHNVELVDFFKGML